MRIRRQLALVMAMALLAVAVGAMAAGAGVERYQFEKTEYLLAATSGSNQYYHTVNVDLTNPCVDEYTYSGAYVGTTLPVGAANYTETISDWVMTATTLSFTSTYNPPGPTYTYSFSGTETAPGSGVWVGNATASNGVFATTVTETSFWQSDYNHGEYVAENVEQYGNPELAHSCIGMPMVSNRDK